MTGIQKAIFTAIKESNKERIYLEEFNKGIKFMSMERYIHEGYQEYTICSDGTAMTKYEVKCKFKSKLFEHNVVKYMVNMYSDGTLGIYFDGTEYQG